MSPEKFLFNKNIFDEPDEEEPEIEEEPPAPTFSEEELEAARKTAYEEAYKKGREEALEESRKSVEQKLSDVLANIEASTGQIFAEEIKREQLFEKEAVHLTLSLFETLFPLYKEKTGFEELNTAIKNIIEKQQAAGLIRIEVHPDMVERVKNIFKDTPALQADQRFEITDHPHLSEHACRLSWKNGGGLYDLDAMAKEAHSIILEHLDMPPSPSLSDHDNVIEDDALPDDASIQNDDEKPD